MYQQILYVVYTKQQGLICDISPKCLDKACTVTVLNL